MQQIKDLTRAGMRVDITATVKWLSPIGNFQNIELEDETGTIFLAVFEDQYIGKYDIGIRLQLTKCYTHESKLSHEIEIIRGKFGFIQKLKV